MLGFGNIISMLSLTRMKQIMRVSGIIVILLGLLTISRSFASFGASNNSQPVVKNEATVNAQNTQGADDAKKNGYQEAKMDLTYRGYEPSTLTVKKGVPVRWIINAKEISGCTSEILLPAFNIDKKLKKGENIIEFTPKVAGTYKFSCGMQMVWGKFIVTESENSVSNGTPEETALLADTQESTNNANDNKAAGCGCGQ
jgi:plastocyanin